jgi:hypothetical protein
MAPTFMHDFPQPGALPIVVDRRCRFECAARIFPVATSSAANSVVVPWRPVSDSPVEINVVRAS